MDLPSDLIEKLNCDYCKNYLSCGPIFLNYKTNKVCCGRCTNRKQNDTNVRYLHYETIASALLFPCKYSKHGCAHKLPFSPGSAHKHELTCGYKKRACPMRSSKTEPHAVCKWVGRFTNLLHHCKILHPDKISPNPCTFQHVFTQPMHETYLITTFNLLFIYSIKIAKDITIKVRLIGDESTTRLYKFTLKIFTKQCNKLQRDGAVFAKNSPTSTPLIIDVSYLSGIFNGTTAVNFKLTITRVDTRQCRFCGKETKLEGACAECKQNATFCRFHNNGCNFTDVSPEKCKKHELYFCKYLIECPDCNLNVTRNDLFKHYVSNHGALRAKSGCVFHVNEGYKQYCVLLHDDALFLCKFSLACYRLLFCVFSPFATDTLKGYACEIRISDPAGNGFNHKLAPKFDLSSCSDWSVNLNMFNYPMWRHCGLDLCVFIRGKGEV